MVSNVTSVCFNRLIQMLSTQSIKTQQLEVWFSVESVHVDPAETSLKALSALTHRDILGTCYAGWIRP